MQPKFNIDLEIRLLLYNIVSMSMIVPDIIQKVREFIENGTLLKKGDRLMLAVSGGPDSVAMVHILKEMGFDLVIAHCNFRLREESDEEEMFVKRLANEMQVGFFSKQFDTQAQAERSGESIQMTARRLRYAFFEEIIRRENLDKGVTAHHLDDESETILMSILRGRSFDLVQGIPAKRGHWVRPLLCLMKDEILDFLAAKKAEFRTDQSNFQDKYIRNNIRLNILPHFEEINPSYRQKLSSLKNEIHSRNVFIDHVFSQNEHLFVSEDQNEVIIDLKKIEHKWGTDHVTLFLEWKFYGIGLRFNEVAAALGLKDSVSGSVVETTSGMILKDRDVIRISFSENERLEDKKDLLVDAFENEWTGEWGCWKMKMQRLTGIDKPDFPDNGFVFYLNGDKIAWPVMFRSWKTGDVMKPLGLNGKKKLSDIFADRKLSVFEKQRQLIVEDNDGIIAVSGYRIAEKVRLKEETLNIVKLELIEKNEDF